jgi:hypothetical protein
MPRIRSIKPQFWIDEDLAKVKRDVRLLYIGLWNICDDGGVFEWRPMRIKAMLFPNDTDINAEILEQWLDDLVNIGNVKKFSNNGSLFGYIPTLLVHQEIYKPSEWRFASPPKELIPSNLLLHNYSPTTNPPVTKEYGSTQDSSEKPIKEKEKEKIKVKDIYKDITLPPFVEKTTWDNYIDMRIKKRARPTIHAVKLIIKDLTKFKEQGQDVNLIIEQSIKNNWTGIFALKDGNNGTHKGNTQKGYAQKPGNRPAGAFDDIEQ